MKESALYLPVKRFLESQGYKVKAEIGDCDVLAVRGVETPVVVELKLTLNLDLILQAVDRLSITSKVYVGVPKNCGALKRRRKRLLKLLKMLGFGLLVVDTEQKVPEAVAILDPSVYQPRISHSRKERLLKEFSKRVGDPNLGGMTKRRGVLTAYRQRALNIARYLEEQGPTKASLVAQALDDPKARDVLYRDVYGWFDRFAKGIYALSPRGQRESISWRQQS